MCNDTTKGVSNNIAVIAYDVSVYIYLTLLQQHVRLPGNDVWPLEVWPDYTDMLGGGALEVSSVCFHGGFFANAKCKFGSIERDPIAVRSRDVIVDV